MKRALLYIALAVVAYFAIKWAVGEVQAWYQGMLDLIFVTH